MSLLQKDPLTTVSYRNFCNPASSNNTAMDGETSFAEVIQRVTMILSAFFNFLAFKL